MSGERDQEQTLNLSYIILSEIVNHYSIQLLEVAEVCVNRMLIMSIL